MYMITSMIKQLQICVLVCEHGTCIMNNIIDEIYHILPNKYACLNKRNPLRLNLAVHISETT